MSQLLRNFSQTPCTYIANEREFEDTWVTCELRKAVEKGYLVTAAKFGNIKLANTIARHDGVDCSLNILIPLKKSYKDKKIRQVHKKYSTLYACSIKKFLKNNLQ